MRWPDHHTARMTQIDRSARRQNQSPARSRGQNSEGDASLCGGGASVAAPWGLAFLGSRGCNSGPFPGHPTTSKASTGEGLNCAKSTVDLPSEVRCWLSARAQSRDLMTCFEPRCAAKCSGVTPFSSEAFGSALCRQRNRAKSKICSWSGPASTWCRAVRPKLSKASQHQQPASSSETAPSISCTVESFPALTASLKVSVSSSMKRSASLRRTGRRGMLRCAHVFL